jgi:hypothetical protein
MVKMSEQLNEALSQFRVQAAAAPQLTPRKELQAGAARSQVNGLS